MRAPPPPPTTRLTAILALCLAVAVACRPSAKQDTPLRMGFFPNLTHAQALVGTGDGTFAKALGKPVTARQFNAGPAAMEALLAGDLDVCYVGPGPASIAWLRTKGEALRVVAGAVSGGAQLVSRGARTARELVGKRVASPQLGNTQDIALRVWLRGQGLELGEGAGRVNVTPLAPADILSLFQRGELAAAWVPEPWGARLRTEAGGVVLVDERDIWEGRSFPSTIVVASTRALRDRHADLVAFLRAHLILTERWKEDPDGFARAANARYGELTRHPLAEGALQDAFERMEPTSDPLARQLAQGARHAQELGFAPAGDLSALVEERPLAEARAAATAAP